MPGKRVSSSGINILRAGGIVGSFWCLDGELFMDNQWLFRSFGLDSEPITMRDGGAEWMVLAGNQLVQWAIEGDGATVWVTCKKRGGGAVTESFWLRDVTREEQEAEHLANTPGAIKVNPQGA